MKRTSLLLWSMLLLCVLAPELRAQAPNVLTYQGRLKESGLAVTGVRSVDIQLCPDLVSACTSTTAQNVTVSNGLFHTTFTVPSSVDFSAGPRLIEVHVGPVGGPLTTLSPREQLTSNAYSVYASSAATLMPSPGGAGAKISTSVFITGNLGVGTLTANSALQLNGPITQATNFTNSSTYSLGANDAVLFVDASAAPVTVTLPPAGGATYGRMYRIYKIAGGGGNSVSVQASGSDVIIGVTSVSGTGALLDVIGCSQPGVQWISRAL